ncbi:Outer membrane protein beta-barrel domain-containing protein [Alteromonadaceae bacterium Bs31]|nr:Outer membrane protein beta-barrel domain-containing protein [Alteromonadaceae bacterium Bs31]
MSNYKLFISVLLFGLSTAAFAGKDTGIYLGGSLGTAGNEVSVGDVNLDDDASAYKVFAGYNFGWVPLFDLAVEGSYVDFGDTSASFDGGKIETSSSAWDVFGLVGVNMGPVGFFAKAGMVSWETEFNISDLEEDLKGKEDGSDPAYGIGAKFQFASFAVRAEYELFDAGEADLSMISVGAAITF